MLNEVTAPGVRFLTALMQRLSSITPDQFRAPTEPRPRRAFRVGMATDYQKALVTLHDILNRQHQHLHLEKRLPFGGHIGLPPEHEFFHAAPSMLEVMLAANLANTFKELSGDFSYHISPTWEVFVVKYPRVPRAERRG